MRFITELKMENGKLKIKGASHEFIVVRVHSFTFCVEERLFTDEVLQPS